MAERDVKRTCSSRSLDKGGSASTELRKWFGHDPAKWEAFQERYFRELSQRSDVFRHLLELIQKEPVVTFLFSAHDEEHNNAVALKIYLEREFHF